MPILDTLGSHARCAAIAGCAAVALLAPGPAAGEAAVDTIGIVKTVQGTASIRRHGKPLTAAPGMPVQLEDSLQTGADGAMGVTLRDGTLIALGSDAQFVIEKFLFKPQDGLLGFVARLLHGDAVYTSGDIGRLAPDSVEFHVPGGVVGVRGTRFAARAP